MAKATPTWPLASAHLFWLTFFFLLPLSVMALLSLRTPTGIDEYAAGLSLANFSRLLQDPYPRIAAESLGYALATTALCILLALPLVLGIAQAPQRWRNPLLLAVILPFWVSALVRIFALQHILGRRGVINSALESLWNQAAIVLPLGPYQPLELLYNGTGVLTGLVYIFLPFAVLPLHAAVARIDPLLIAASRDLGASAWQTTVRVILPLAKPGIIAAITLICIPALGAFYIPEMLGGPSDILIGNIIELQFKKANNWPFGAALSVTMLALTLIVFIAAKRSSRLMLTNG